MFGTSTAQRKQSDRRSPWGDLLVLSVFCIVLYFFVGFASRGISPLETSAEISLSLWSLPKYAFFSLTRATLSYLLSLAFTLTVGYLAAKNKVAEKIIVPFLDIGQSVPVLGFMPGLILAFMALFPHNNLGLEFACILMIFTGQVWNMAFSYYGSLKSVPTQYYELADNVGMGWRKKLLYIELPFAATGLAWNSLISMAGGWFFLTICESFKLGERSFRIPGLGSYISLAIEQNDLLALVCGVLVMFGLVIAVDFLVWRPVLAWSQKYRFEEFQDQTTDIPFITLLLQDSWILSKSKAVLSWLRREDIDIDDNSEDFNKKKSRREKLAILWQKLIDGIDNLVYFVSSRPKLADSLGWLVYASIILLLIIGLGQILDLIKLMSFKEWMTVFIATFWTLLRVTACIVIASLWTVPAGLWIGSSARLTRIFQPLIQLAASFPAPMIFPLVLIAFDYIGVPLGFSSVILMAIGVQWYILFNVLAGSSMISSDLRDTLKIIGVSKKNQWLKLYLPSIFPSLVTGWNVAAGGAWNASIICEYVIHHKEVVYTNGLGALISLATDQGDMPMLASCIMVMCLTVVIINRGVWGTLYRIADEKFRFDR